ncbi:hypothetical protein BGW42_001966 [Actinomortierella wolfii]|nr:hypothetical protein BGW42_001966 [Actinomortierella wolfii]
MRERVPQVVEGLDLYLDYVTEEEEKNLITQLDAREWAGLGVEPNPEMKRRHQHYGGTFSYRYRKVVGKKQPLPDMFSFLSQRLQEDKIYEVVPNSIIVNEYNAGQGSDYYPSHPPTSLIVMNGSSRYDYKHSISKNLVEYAPDGTEIVRSRRVSITYRDFLIWEDDPEATVVPKDDDNASSSCGSCQSSTKCE